MITENDVDNQKMTIRLLENNPEQTFRHILGQRVERERKRRRRKRQRI